MSASWHALVRVGAAMTREILRRARKDFAARARVRNEARARGRRPMPERAEGGLPRPAKVTTRWVRTWPCPRASRSRLPEDIEAPFRGRTRRASVPRASARDQAARSPPRPCDPGSAPILSATWRGRKASSLCQVARAERHGSSEGRLAAEYDVLPIPGRREPGKKRLAHFGRRLRRPFVSSHRGSHHENLRNPSD
jgi:hypothetical protein